MKKFLALVLSLCLVLSLAACGGKTADDDTGEGSKTGGTIQVGLNSATCLSSLSWLLQR